MAIRTTEANKKDWNVVELVRRIDRGEIDFELFVQRGLVWDIPRSSLLIQSILLGYPISVFYFNQTGKIYEGLEGKQRSNAIYRFYKGEYRLHMDTPPVLNDDDIEVPIARCSFNDLPDYFQNRIMTYGLTVFCFSDLTHSEKIDFFTRINSGLSVSAADLTRVKVLSRKVFLSLIEHPAMKFAVNEKNKLKCMDEDILEDLWCILYGEIPGLRNKYREPALAVAVVTDEQKTEITQGLNYLHAFYASAYSTSRMVSKMRIKIHIVSLIYMAVMAIRQGISQDEFCIKAKKFFICEAGRPSVSNKYNMASSVAAARPDQVQVRMDELRKALI